MKDGPGLMFGIGPGAPMNTSGCLADYLPPAQRIVVTPNNDTFYGVGFVDLGRGAGGDPDADRRASRPLLDDPDRRRLHQRRPHARLGSGTPGGKFLLVGPDWQGEKPDGFVDVMRLPTNYGGVFPRSFAARTPEAKAQRDRGAEPDGRLSAEPEPGRAQAFDCEAIAQTSSFRPASPPR